jgi:hypothetical protein
LGISSLLSPKTQTKALEIIFYMVNMVYIVPIP